MNAKRRDVLKRAMGYLSTAKDLIEDARDEEQECLDNMPENLFGSERYSKMEEAVDNLNSALDYFDEINEYLDSAIE